MYAAGDKDAFLMMPPETVCGGEVRTLVWTGDGGYLVVGRDAQNVTAADVASFGAGVKPTPEDMARMQPRTELLVWSLKTHKLRTVLTGSATLAVDLYSVQVLPGSDRVILSLTETVASSNRDAPRQVSEYAMLSARDGSLTRLDGFGGVDATQVRVELAPNAPLGVLETFEADKPAWSVRLFGPAGPTGTPFTVPAKSYVGYNEAGSLGYVVRAQENGKRTIKWQTLDPRTGSPGAAVPFVPRESPKPETLVSVETSVGTDVSAPTILLNVVGGKAGESGIVTTDGDKPLVSPKLDAIAYVGQGSAMVRTMARVPRAAFEDARRAAQRTAALSQAKQVGIAFIMYASDMDDVLPGQSADYRTAVGPYMKNDKLFDGFTYTFGGGNMADVEKPAETEMGYVAGPGGRAVIYVDGHAKWVPDKP